ncbi:MAG: ankyrin repeat domain-containing protein [Acetobacter sp.]|nr:ankyrin repeat domain-containing protein [Acetobacter sp.]
MKTNQNERNELFLEACAGGFSDVVDFMLNAGGINLNYLDKDNHSALWLAVHGKHLAIAQELLCQRGLHLSTINSAIEEAHKQGINILVQELMEYPHAVSASPRDQTGELIRLCDGLHGFNFDVLTAAIKMKNLALAEKIIDVAEIYIDVNADYTPLVSAIEAEDITLIKQLLTKAEIDVNACGLSEVPPLICAVKSPEIVKLLLDRRELNVRRKDSKGNTALIAAVRENAYETVKLLVENKKQPLNTLNKDASCFLTPESRLNLANPYGDTATAGTDRTFGVQPLYGRRLARGDYKKAGLTALQTAVALGNSEIALYLIKTSGVHIDIPLPGGYPLLFLAIANKMDTVVDALLERLSPEELNEVYPDPLYSDRDVTALHVAFRARDLATFRKLLKLPLEVNNGVTPDAELEPEARFTKSILGEVFNVHRCQENVYDFLAALMERPDIDANICANFPYDDRTIRQIIEEEQPELLKPYLDDEREPEGYTWHC